MILYSHYPAVSAGPTLPPTLAFPVRLLLAEKCSMTATFATAAALPETICIGTTVVTAIWKQIPGWRHYGINE